MKLIFKLMKKIPHIPVLLKETVSWLVTDPDGIYLDCTVGYGGHSELILQNISNTGQLIGIDLDPYALKYAEKRLSTLQKSYSLYNRNYREYPILLQSLKMNKLTGIIFDLGSSSSQLNTEHRGFSFQSDAPLDMRFNPKKGQTAADFLNNSTEKDIAKIISQYGEERYFKKIANSIFKAVNLGQMNTTYDLKKAVSKCIHPKHLNKSLARVFQSIRIKINDEINSLIEALESSLTSLNTGSRIAVISFHSIEDRIVKSFFNKNSKSCICPPKFPICNCNTVPFLKILTRKGISPSKTELNDNSRSRSARLRVAERI